MTIPLPTARGPISAAVLRFLLDRTPLPDDPSLTGIDALVDDDLHLALWCCYELHHHGFLDVDDELEWEPELIRFRRSLEHAFETALRDEMNPEQIPTHPPTAIRVIGRRASPPLSTMLADEGTLEQLREFAIHRSLYQLKEADAHTFAIPRLRGPGRSALIEIQLDEYGGGRPGEAHAELFAAAMRELGLDDGFAAHLDRLPGVTLATDNLVEMFGLHRRLRGALVGHLALFETTSIVPMSRYLVAARRLGEAGLPAVERFYAVHVEADAHHGRIAVDQMVEGLLRTEPHLAADIVFGAAALSRVEGRFAHHLLTSWSQGRSSLRPIEGPDTPSAPTGEEPARAAPAQRGAVVSGPGSGRIHVGR